MKILSDRHHAGLTNSLILLLEKRLGHELFFQKGLEWYPDFWGVFPHIDTAKQYLERELEGVNGVTLEEFKNIKFDILLCSIPEHVPIWIKLKELYQPQAKLIFQVGNVWTFDHTFPIKNILASSVVYPIVGFKILQYHQEFPLDIYSYEPVKNTKKIYSFINCLNVIDLYKKDWELFLELEKLLPEFTFESYGGQTRGGAIAPQSEVARLTKEADFIFHVKNRGDGFSYGMFTAAACGRPIITRRKDYEGKLADPLIDITTSITVDNATPETIAHVIRECSESGRLVEMGKAIHNKFEHLVNYDKEEKMVKEFLESLN